MSCSLLSKAEEMGQSQAAPLDTHVWNCVFAALRSENIWQAVPVVVCDLREADVLKICYLK